MYVHLIYIWLRGHNLCYQKNSYHPFGIFNNHIEYHIISVTVCWLN